MRKRAILAIVAILLLTIAFVLPACNPARSAEPVTPVLSPFQLLQNQVTGLDGRMTTIEKGIPTMQTDIASIKNGNPDTKLLTDGMKKIQDSQTTDEANLKSLTDLIAALTTRVATLEKALAPASENTAGGITDNILDVSLVPILPIQDPIYVYISGVSLDTTSYKNITTSKSLSMPNWSVYFTQKKPTGSPVDPTTGTSCKNIVFTTDDGLNIPVNTTLSLKVTLTIAYYPYSVLTDFSGWKVKSAFEDDYNGLTVSVKQPTGGIVDAGTYNFTITIANGS